MKYSFFLLAAVSISVSLGSCVDLEVPPPPDVKSRLDAYENPTAKVGSAIMAAVADQIEELRDDIQDSEVFEEILAVIVDVQEELDEATDEDGNLELEGVVFPSPNGAVDVTFICEGWDESQTEPDPANGVIKLTLTLGAGGIGPLVWGEADACKFPAVTETDRFEASYDGGIAVHLGDPVSTSQNLYELPITFFITGTIGFERAELGVDVSFRVALSFDETSGDVALDRLEILVKVPDNLVQVPGATEYFVYFFKFDTLDQGIRDATGTFSCRLRPENGEPPGCFIGSDTLFSW